MQKPAREQGHNINLTVTPSLTVRPQPRKMRAKRSLGQNFLRDEAVVERIVNALDLKESDTVIEIGPGDGALTKKLVETGANVVAIEIDRELVPALRKQFQSYPNFRVIEADVLKTEFGRLIETGDAGKAKLVGNLPYYISTAILQKLTGDRSYFSKAVLMLQREVAQRVTALPGDSERGFLTVIVEAAFEASCLFDVPPTAFFPQPKVWSSVIALTPKPPSPTDEPPFADLLGASFVQKRKTILNNLKNLRSDASLILHEANIDQKRRAETLSLDEWLSLYHAFTKK